jgi:hypothetical protein
MGSRSFVESGSCGGSRVVLGAEAAAGSRVAEKVVEEVAKTCTSIRLLEPPRCRFSIDRVDEPSRFAATRHHQKRESAPASAWPAPPARPNVPTGPARSPQPTRAAQRLWPAGFPQLIRAAQRLRPTRPDRSPRPIWPAGLPRPGHTIGPPRPIRLIRSAPPLRPVGAARHGRPARQARSQGSK